MHQGLKGREMEVLEDSPCLCLGKMILSVKSGSPVIQQAYLERPTSVDCFWQTEMKKQFSNSFWRQSSATFKRQANPPGREVWSPPAALRANCREGAPDSREVRTIITLNSYWLCTTGAWGWACPLSLQCEYKLSPLHFFLWFYRQKIWATVQYSQSHIKI